MTTLRGDDAATQSADSLARLRYRIRRLHRERGAPSTRMIEKRVGRQISHSTISKLLKCYELPRWGVLEVLVEGLDGDKDEFLQLWKAVKDQEEPLLALPPAFEDREELYDERAPIPQPNTFEEADAAQDDLDERAEAQEQEENSLRDQLVNARDELVTLNEQIVDLNGQVEQLQRQATGDSSRRRALEAQISHLEKERDRLHAQIAELRDRLRWSGEDKIDLLAQRVQLATWRTELNFEWARSEELLKHRVEIELHNEREHANALQEQLTALQFQLAQRTRGQT